MNQSNGIFELSELISTFPPRRWEMVMLFVLPGGFLQYLPAR